VVRSGLRNATVRELTYAALLLPGLVFFWTLLRVDPVPKAYPKPGRAVGHRGRVVGDAVLGLAVIADQHLIAKLVLPGAGQPWGRACAPTR
jgi:hypothetical protein